MKENYRILIVNGFRGYLLLTHILKDRLLNHIDETDL